MSTARHRSDSLARAAAKVREMNQQADGVAAEAGRTARVSASIPDGRGLTTIAELARESIEADGGQDLDLSSPFGLAITAVRNLGRYAPDGKRVELSIEWQCDEAAPDLASDVTELARAAIKRWKDRAAKLGDIPEATWLLWCAADLEADLNGIPRQRDKT